MSEAELTCLSDAHFQFKTRMRLIHKTDFINFHGDMSVSLNRNPLVGQISSLSFRTRVGHFLTLKLILKIPHRDSAHPHPLGLQDKR